MFQRTPGEGRYARAEREQRWILARLPADCYDPVEILDRYLVGTRLRLRQMTSGNTVVYKLGQKVRRLEDSPEYVSITNIYLSTDEYSTFAKLDALVLHKTRWKWDAGERLTSVDEFHDSLQGFILTEVELAETEALLTAPPGAIADVTFDSRFSGGHLASLDRRTADDLLHALMHERHELT